ncbi:unnamed protein product [Choristocarpus tenellus]
MIPPYRCRLRSNIDQQSCQFQHHHTLKLQVGLMGDDAQKETAGKGDAHPTGRNGLRLLSLVMVIDLMSLSVQIPTMVRAYETYEIDLRMQGWLAGTFGLISFFVAPVLGRVSDSMGRVTMLKVSAVGGLLGSFGSFYARGKWAFIAARTLPAMLKCSLPISQAYIVDTSEGNAERSKNLVALLFSFFSFPSSTLKC